MLDQVFADVCLDERVIDGIFKMEEVTHMDALREYLLKRGIDKNIVIEVTNRMVEGRFPERQAYNKDGILVTFPTPKHKAKAIARGTHFEKNPVPQLHKSQGASTKKAPPGSNPELGELPADSGGGYKNDNTKEKSKVPTIFQGDQQLEIEPSPETKSTASFPQPPPSASPSPPRTPERIEAEKEVARQIFSTDPASFSNPAFAITKDIKEQLHELIKKADEMGLREAVKFLSYYVKSE